MKTIILIFILSIFNISSAIAQSDTKHDTNEKDFSWNTSENYLSWKTSYNVSIGEQIGTFFRSQTFVQFSVFLLRDDYLKYSNLLGVGVSLDTNGKTYLTINPITFPIGHFSVFQPVLAIPITGDASKLGLALGYYF